MVSIVVFVSILIACLCSLERMSRSVLGIFACIILIALCCFDLYCVYIGFGSFLCVFSFSDWLLLTFIFSCIVELESAPKFRSCICHTSLLYSSQ